MNLQDFLNYFLSPGYDIPKTLTYSIAFVISIYLIFKLLKKIDIKVDRRLALALTPYIIFGGALRSLEDAGIVSSYWFVTLEFIFLFLQLFHRPWQLEFFYRRKRIFTTSNFYSR